MNNMHSCSLIIVLAGYFVDSFAIKVYRTFKTGRVERTCRWFLYVSTYIREHNLFIQLFGPIVQKLVHGFFQCIDSRVTLVFVS